MASNLHETSIVIDGLIISDFGRSVFEDMRRGGLTAANCTCCVWEGFTETMRNVMRWKAWFSEHGDILKQVYTTADVLKAKEEGKTGIILGWQNITGLRTKLAISACSKSSVSASSRWRTTRKILLERVATRRRTAVCPTSAARASPR